MTQEIEDVLTPPVLDGAGDFTGVTGAARVMQQVVRLLFMDPGALLHRPEIGGGLTRWRGKPPTPDNLQRATNQADQTIEAIGAVERHTVALKATRAGAWTMDITISVAGETLTRRDITLEL